MMSSDIEHTISTISIFFFKSARAHISENLQPLNNLLVSPHPDDEDETHQATIAET